MSVVSPSSCIPIDSAYRDLDPRSDPLRRILFAAFVLTGTVYFGWRLTVFNPTAMIFSSVFYVFEIVPFVSGCLLLFITLKRQRRDPVSAPAGLCVDVFVTTYDEHIDIVRRSLVAALRIRYPHQTWLLDDGNRPAFAAMAKALGCRYLGRSQNIHAKAGNLNNALTRATGEFVLVLDADHCAQPDFLNRVLGYFSNSKIGFVQTPQEFYNFDSFQHGREKYDRLVWHEQSRFNHVEQPGRDAKNATLMCGCSSVVRRAALDDIGGFATGTVTEDMHTAVRMMKRGWLPAYHDEPLAFGIAPPDMGAFTRQRLRWAEGNLQVCRLERLPFAANIGWQANLCYGLLTFYYVDSWRKIALYMAPVISLFLDVPPVYAAPPLFALMFMPFLLAGMLSFKEFSSGFGRILQTEVDAMARMTAGLPAIWGLFRPSIKFRVTPKVVDGKLPHVLLVPQYVVLGSSLAAVVYAAVRHGGILVGAWPNSGIPTGIAAVLAILAIWHMMIAVLVIRNSHRTARPSSVNYEHATPLPILLRAEDTQLDLAIAQTISTEFATIASTPELEWFIGTQLQVQIFVPTGTIETSARVERAAGDELKVYFCWSGLAERDELDQALHAGRWPRVVTGRYEMAPTPLESLGLLAPPQTRLMSIHRVWQPILVRGNDEELHLGYVWPAGGQPREMITFGPASQEVEIVWPGERGTASSFYLLGPAQGPLFDEGALSVWGGTRFALRQSANHRRMTIVEMAGTCVQLATAR